MTGSTPRRILKDGAIPTLFKHFSSKKRRLSSIKRAEKQTKKQVSLMMFIACFSPYIVLFLLVSFLGYLELYGKKQKIT